MEKEIRSLSESESQMRATAGGTGRNISGYGIVFNSLSKDLGGFKELIMPEAIEGVLSNSDIFATLNHSLDRGVLARSTKGKGTLGLEVDNKGLRYSFTAPRTALGDEVIEGVRRGDIRTSSFSFNIAPDGERWERKGGQVTRYITKFSKIFDVSMVYHEAYESTSVENKNIQDGNEN